VTASPTYSLVVPVYNNAGSLGDLISEITRLALAFNYDFEAIFVVDGGTDNSSDELVKLTVDLPYRTVLVEHSRNFGAFEAIRTGLHESDGEIIAVRSADLQEPNTLIDDLFRSVKNGECEVALGVRQGRTDVRHRRAGARIFWSLYRRYVQPQMPGGGVDVFACTRRVRDALLDLREANSSLVGLLIWLGYPFTVVPYIRLQRNHGKSEWRFGKLVDYMSDSAFAFSHTPIRVIRWLGIIGSSLGALAAVVLVILRLTGSITEAGYTPIMLMILVMGSLNLAAIGVLGSFVWRTFENTKRRPHAVVQKISKRN
jgi:glycosyltransferase involved in cell wall biosynthesis